MGQNLGNPFFQEKVSQTLPKELYVTLQGILFDLDDTLVDRDRSIETYAPRFMERFSAHIGETSAEALARAIGDADRSGYRPRGELFEELLSSVPWRSPPAADELADHWHAVFGTCAQPATGLDATLAALSDRGMRIGVVTNSARPAVQNAKIDTVGIRPRLDSVVVSGEAGFEKPDERIFRMALAELGLEPAQAWFVGDNPVKDILGASAVGLTAVWMRGNFDWPDEHEQPDLQIDSLEELLPLVDGRAAR